MYLNREYPNIPLMVVMVGLPGSGKSNIANDIAVEQSETIVISLGDLRREMLGDNSGVGYNGKLHMEFYKRIRENLKAGRNVIIDATNLKKRYRMALLNDFKDLEYTPIAVCVYATSKTCIANFEKHGGNISKERLDELWKHYQPPTFKEGFKAIIELASWQSGFKNCIMTYLNYYWYEIKRLVCNK